MTLEEDGGRKDYLKNSAVNMATIFGVRADAYSLNTPPPPSLHVNTKRRTTPPDKGDDRGSIAEWRKSIRDKKRDNNNGSSGSAAKKKKRKLTSL